MENSEIHMTREQRDRLTPKERQNYLLALITMATADDHIAEEELFLIKKRAKMLNCQLKKSDLKTYDISRIAQEVRTPSLRNILFQDLIAMARADRNWHPEELATLRYFSDAWAQPLPQHPFPGVDWKDVIAPTAADLEMTSIRKQKALQHPRNKRIVKSADPGIMWGWVGIATGIYIGLSILFGVLGFLLRDEDPPGFGELDMINTLLGLFTCFLTGLIVGTISPARTLREPGIGVCLPLVLIGAFMVLVAMDSGAGMVSSVLIGISFAMGIQFCCALLGAYIGEAFTDTY